MATMRDVAAAAGVSLKTVSRVQNDDPHVLPATRMRVEATMRELGYVPNALATTFRSGRSPVVGVAVPDIVDPFFAAIVNAVEEAALTEDLSTVVTSLGHDPARERQALESVLRRQLSGLVVAPTTTDHAYLKPWAERIPIAFVDRAPGRLVADSFTQDDRGGARLATAHLIGHGHRRIGFLGDSLALPTVAERLEGYREALDAASLSYDPSLVMLGAATRPGAAEALKRLRAPALGVTAVFSSDARCTMAAVPTLTADPIALTAFGDFPLADSLTPSITVIAQDPAELGRLAAARLFERSAHPSRRLRRRTVLPVTLVERESCRVR
ncbi:LacI family DNA-binding transcriptional regulator [Herbiconiux sp. KACC 21604]|uniref:LacI family DNA-binding transcriptional regulator n=1 Tax=unclassified Herbiconiux TaxID=2618217 RepID=UPI0014919171|nr:LacI family DNA-binding transcriptional regulator [Herbiconiux sp. SALV-R1]QJU53109.1 LacI family DNA-binding transcriptional regulator [Herbiconiux sp. SALV-R1]WPO88048.1 LacI family DNA-binding transcriptional regulator [Herbiconiux sp. KACC 21604]